jgi:hypothetical protein
VPILCKIDPHGSPGAPDHPHHMVFVVWGLHLLGPIKKASEGLTHLLVVVDKFTKSIEARPLDKIGSKQGVSFVHDIIFRFGVPNSMITNKDTQFTR